MPTTIRHCLITLTDKNQYIKVAGFLPLRHGCNHRIILINLPRKPSADNLQDRMHWDWQRMCSIAEGGLTMHSSCPPRAPAAPKTARWQLRSIHSCHMPRTLLPSLPAVTGRGEISAIPLTMHPSGKASVKLKAFFLASVVSWFANMNHTWLYFEQSFTKNACESFSLNLKL